MATITVTPNGTDDTATLTAAKTTLLAAGGGTLRLRGTEFITDPVVWSRDTYDTSIDVEIVGDFWGTRLRSLAGNAPTFVFQKCSDFSLRNIDVRGDEVGSLLLPYNGLRLLGCRRVVLENVGGEGFFDIAFITGNIVDPLRVYPVGFEDAATPSTHITWYHPNFQSAKNDGIYLGYAQDVKMYSLVSAGCNGNVVESNAASLYIYGADIDDAGVNLISIKSSTSLCHLYDIVGASGVGGIAVDNTGQAVRGVKIVNPDIRSCTQSGIALDGTTAGNAFEDVVIINPLLTGNSQYPTQDWGNLRVNLPGAARRIESVKVFGGKLDGTSAAQTVLHNLKAWEADTVTLVGTVNTGATNQASVAGTVTAYSWT